MTQPFPSAPWLKFTAPEAAGAGGFEVETNTLSSYTVIWSLYSKRFNCVGKITRMCEEQCRVDVCQKWNMFSYIASVYAVFKLLKSSAHHPWRGGSSDNRLSRPRSGYCP